jgi:hypothetical protein
MEWQYCLSHFLFFFFPISISPFILSGHIILLLTSPSMTLPLPKLLATCRPCCSAPSLCCSPMRGRYSRLLRSSGSCKKDEMTILSFFLFSFLFLSHLYFTLYLIGSSYPPPHVACPLRLCPCPLSWWRAYHVAQRHHRVAVLWGVATRFVEELRFAQKWSNDHSVFLFSLSFYFLFLSHLYFTLYLLSSYPPPHVARPLRLCLCPRSCRCADHVARRHHCVILWGAATHICRGA